MKFQFTAVALCAALAACAQPKTASEMKSLVASHPFGEIQSHHIDRPIADVNAGVTEGAKKCMNQTIDHDSIGFDVHGALTFTSYDRIITSDLVSKGEGVELAMWSNHEGAIEFFDPERGQLKFVAETAPSSGGAELKMYGGSFGYDELFDAVRSWADGSGVICPDLDF